MSQTETGKAEAPEERTEEEVAVVQGRGLLATSKNETLLDPIDQGLS